MQLNIRHSTRYRHDASVPYGLLQLRKQPQSSRVQTVGNWAVHISGGSEELTFRDHNYNSVILVSYEEDVNEIEITSEGAVETLEANGVYGHHDCLMPTWYYRRDTALTRPGPRLRQLVREVARDGRPDLDRLHVLSETILEAVRYDTGRTDTATDAESVLAAGHGVCQDHTHVMLAAARLLGFPARYVSGYLLMPEREQQDAGHAWADVYLPDIGWVGFDVANAISPDEHYVRVATGLDYGEAAPVSGLHFGDSRESMAVTVQVQQ